MNRSNLELIHSLNTMVLEVIRLAYPDHQTVLKQLGISSEIAEKIATLSGADMGKLTSTNQMLFILTPMNGSDSQISEY